MRLFLGFGMHILKALNIAAGVVCIVGLLAGLIVQFQNKNEIVKNNNAVTFYFTTHFKTLQYAEVEKNYGVAASKVQAQLSDALNDQSPLKEKKREKREICCKGASVTVLGIAENAAGGVTVMSGISYAQSKAPAIKDLEAKVNQQENVSVIKAVDSQEASSTPMAEPICSPSKCISEITTSPPEATCPPCPTSPTCPEQPVCPTEGTPSQLPCEIDVSIYLDGSSAVTDEQYQQEVDFLTNKLASKWYVTPSWSDVSIGAYGSDGAPWFGGFWYHEHDDHIFREDLKKLAMVPRLGAPSLTTAMNATEWLMQNRQRFGHEAVYVTLTYSSEEADLKAAKQYVDKFGSSLIVVGIGSKFNSNSFQSALGINPIVANSLDDALAEKITNAICNGQPTAPTPKPGAGLGCDYDVLLVMDGSAAVPASVWGNQVDFMMKQLAPSWIVDPFHTEAGIGMIQGGMASFGARMFAYANNLKFNEYISLYSAESPSGRTDIAQGMQAVVQTVANNRRDGKKVATLAFLYDAQEEDVRKAVQYSRKLTLNEDKLIIVTSGAANAQLFNQLSNERIHLVNWSENTALELNDAICAPRKAPPTVPVEPTTTPTQPPEPTTTTVEPTTTSPEPTTPKVDTQLPCEIDVSVYLDRSSAVTEQQYQEEVDFLTNKLASKWYVTPSWSDVSIGAYGSEGAPWYGGFWYHEHDDHIFREDLKNLSLIKPLGAPSLTTGLNASEWLMQHRQRLEAKYVTFMYSSDEEDLKASKKYVEAYGSNLIFVGVGPNFNSNSFHSVMGVNPIVANSLDDAVAEKIVSAICMGRPTARPPRPGAGLGCDYDVMLAMDCSKSVPASVYSDEVNFIEKQLSPSWIIGPADTEASIGYVQGRMAMFDSRSFAHANNQKFQDAMWSFSTHTPDGFTSITDGMKFIIGHIASKRNKGKNVATLFFLYNAKDEDVKKAVKYSRQLALNGDKLIVITYGLGSSHLMSQLSNERLHLVNWNEQTVLELNKAICSPRKEPPPVPVEPTTTPTQPPEPTTTTVEPTTTSPEPTTPKPSV